MKTLQKRRALAVASVIGVFVTVAGVIVVKVFEIIFEESFPWLATVSWGLFVLGGAALLVVACLPASRAEPERGIVRWVGATTLSILGGVTLLYAVPDVGVRLYPACLAAGVACAARAFWLARALRRVSREQV